MTEASSALARSWLAKSNGDLAVAKILIEGDEPHLDAGVYHCQQAAEKSLKALLALDAHPFPRSHNLRSLLDLALPQHPELSILADACMLLTPYATEFRYPGDIFEPDPSEATEALLLAQDIINAIAPSIPAADHR
jgi:HEPN domain-containing protein